MTRIDLAPLASGDDTAQVDEGAWYGVVRHRRTGGAIVFAVPAGETQCRSGLSCFATPEARDSIRLAPNQIGEQVE